MLSLKAAILHARGDVPGALALLNRGVGDHPGDEDLLMDLALLCLDQNSVDLGIRVLEAGAARFPGSVRLAMMLGVFLVRASRSD
ncbi:MAG: tetratricopeptide repeat protein [Acidobacteria bacterium]|nr:tetratricopeptide repeat protein [Acidobacteriota bacterium]